ncbi:glyoxylase-like metal-dependent hydrolase (beta-lactamase superfamily II) [Paenibacillus sp. DS2015]|uniref:MBL fold metallo-hydrolase n=1 Tax=Paenibacillus sp. DS2015 TaxID=3373917 RepID=UPI003D1F4CED
MKSTTIQKVHQLSFLPRLFPINVYLVEEDDGLTLIDTGMPFSKNGILKAASKLGKPIVRIVLTHAHGDHVGALDTLKVALPDSKVYISRRDNALLSGNTELEAHEPQTKIRGSVPTHIVTKPDYLLEDLDRIGSLQAIASPGHTPGHMAFIDTRSDILIAGDALQTRGGLAVSGHMNPLFPFPALATWNKETALESAKRLLLLNPTWLAVGHGLVMQNPSQAMDLAITKAQAALKET